MILYVIVITALLGGTAAIFMKQLYDEKRRSTILSIKEAVMLTDFPILTFNNNGVKLRFLLDTGSNRNIIRSDILPSLVITDRAESDESMKLHNIGDNTISSNMYLICFNYDSLKFRAAFLSVDECAGFDKIKKESGVEVNGILGAPFMTKYKYILDLDNLKVKINK